jgi:hypothetical protein
MKTRFILSDCTAPVTLHVFTLSIGKSKQFRFFTSAGITLQRWQVSITPCRLPRRVGRGVLKYGARLHAGNVHFRQAHGSEVVADKEDSALAIRVCSG